MLLSSHRWNPLFNKDSGGFRTIFIGSSYQAPGSLSEGTRSQRSFDFADFDICLVRGRVLQRAQKRRWLSRRIRRIGSAAVAAELAISPTNPVVQLAAMQLGAAGSLLFQAEIESRLLFKQYFGLIFVKSCFSLASLGVLRWKMSS